MEINRHTNFFSFIFGFVLAVALSSFLFISPLISLLILIIGLAIIISDRQKEALLISLFLISFSLGALRYSIKDFHESVVPVETGIVISEPEDKDNFRRFVFLSDNGEKVLVSAPLYSPVQYGDQVEVTGEFKIPGIIEDKDTLKSFDYGKYLSKDNIYFTLNSYGVEILSSGHGNSLKSALFKFKKSFVDKAKEILSEPYASLLMGLLVSGKEALPKDILEEFRRAGVIHIVVLSGFNITLIAEFLRRMFQTLFIYAKLPAIPQAAAGASIIGITLFVLMTGAQATVIRAAVMAVIVIGARLFGRNYSASRALVGAGFLMLLQNPKILIFDPSFQLSFLATLGLICFMSPIQKKFEFITDKLKIREIVSQTLATQVAVLPLLIFMTGTFSPLFLPANVLTLIVVPWTMLVGFLAILLSYINTIVAIPLAYAVHLLLSWILLVARVFANF